MENKLSGGSSLEPLSDIFQIFHASQCMNNLSCSRTHSKKKKKKNISSLITINLAWLMRDVSQAEGLTRWKKVNSKPVSIFILWYYIIYYNTNFWET